MNIYPSQHSAIRLQVHQLIYIRDLAVLNNNLFEPLHQVPAVVHFMKISINRQSLWYYLFIIIPEREPKPGMQAGRTDRLVRCGEQLPAGLAQLLHAGVLAGLAHTSQPILSPELSRFLGILLASPFILNLTKVLLGKNPSPPPLSRSVNWLIFLIGGTDMYQPWAYIP